MTRLKFMNMYKDENGNFYYTAWNKKNEELGWVHFDMEWKKYSWKQFDGVEMTSDCLKEVTDFMDSL